MGAARTRLVPLFAFVVGSCIGSAAEHQVLGDRAYGERRFGDALVEYRLAQGRGGRDPDLYAKLGAAAWHARDLVAAAEAYVSLADVGGEERAGEAGDGLARVARLAAEVGDRTGMAAALDGLQRVAPGRALGRFAWQLARQVSEDPPSTELLSVLVHAAAAAPDARLLDSLAYGYAVVLRQLGRCEQAVPVLESLLRRHREPAVAQLARYDVGQCAYAVGRELHLQELPLSAEEWYRRATRWAGTTRFGRAAYVGLGDVLLARGEFVGAAEAYESALVDAAPGDSIAGVATARLNILGRAGTGVP